MGKGTSMWTMLCMTCGEGPSLAALLDVSTASLEGGTPPPIRRTFPFFFSSLGVNAHAVQVVQYVLAPSSYDSLVCVPTLTARTRSLSCKARPRHREGGPSGGDDRPAQPSVAPRPAPLGSGRLLLGVCDRARGLAAGGVLVSPGGRGGCAVTCVYAWAMVVAAGINRRRCDPLLRLMGFGQVFI